MVDSTDCSNECVSAAWICIEPRSALFAFFSLMYSLQVLETSSFLCEDYIFPLCRCQGFGQRIGFAATLSWLARWVAYQLSQESWSLASFFGGNSRKGLSRSTLEYFLEHGLHSLMQGSAGWSWSSEVSVIWYFQRSNNISAVSDDPKQLSSACDDCDSWSI